MAPLKHAKKKMAKFTKSEMFQSCQLHTNSNTHIWTQNRHLGFHAMLLLKDPNRVHAAPENIHTYPMDKGVGVGTTHEIFRGGGGYGYFSGTPPWEIGIEWNLN